MKNAILTIFLFLTPLALQAKWNTEEEAKRNCISFQDCSYCKGRGYKKHVKKTWKDTEPLCMTPKTVEWFTQCSWCSLKRKTAKQAAINSVPSSMMYLTTLCYAIKGEVLDPNSQSGQYRLKPPSIGNVFVHDRKFNYYGDAFQQGANEIEILRVLGPEKYLVRSKFSYFRNYSQTSYSKSMAIVKCRNQYGYVDNSKFEAYGKYAFVGVECYTNSTIVSGQHYDVKMLRVFEEQPGGENGPFIR